MKKDKQLEELERVLLDIMSKAKVPISTDAAVCCVALRREIMIYQSIMDALLDGLLEAEYVGKDDTKPPKPDEFVFRSRNLPLYSTAKEGEC